MQLVVLVRWVASFVGIEWPRRGKTTDEKTRLQPHGIFIRAWMVASDFLADPSVIWRALLASLSLRTVE